MHDNLPTTYPARLSFVVGRDENRLLVVAEHGEHVAEVTWRPSDNDQSGPGLAPQPARLRSPVAVAARRARARRCRADHQGDGIVTDLDAGSAAKRARDQPNHFSMRTSEPV